MDEKKDNLCATCGSSFTKRSDLVRHMRVHTGEKPFKCDFCGTRFSQASSLKTHVRKHTGERPFQCPYCHSSFAHGHRLKSHVMKFHISSKPFCSLCKIKLGSISDFEKHVLSHLSKNKKERKKEETLNINNETDNCNCENHPGSRDYSIETNCLSSCKDYCTSSFVCEKVELPNNVGKGIKYTVTETHECICDNCDESSCLQTKALPKNYMCEICGSLYDGLKSLERHVKAHKLSDSPHNTNPAQPSQAKPDAWLSYKRSFTCHICGVFFNSFQQLEVHLRIHTGTRPFLCKVCGMKFTHSRVLEIHMKIHEDDRCTRLCNECGLTFTSVESFNQHIYLHGKEKNIRYSESGSAHPIYLVQEASINKGLLIKANEETIHTLPINSGDDVFPNRDIMLNSATAQCEDENSLSVSASSPAYSIKSIPSFQDILMYESSDLKTALSNCDTCDNSHVFSATGTGTDNNLVTTSLSNEFSKNQIIDFYVDKSKDFLDNFERLDYSMSKINGGHNSNSYNHNGDVCILNGTVVVEQANILPFSINAESSIASVNTIVEESLIRKEDNILTSISTSLETELNRDTSENGPVSVINNNQITATTYTNNNNNEGSLSEKGSHNKKIGQEIKDSSKNYLACNNCPLGLLEDSVVAELCKDGCLDEIVDKSLLYNKKSNTFLDSEPEIEIPKEIYTDDIISFHL